MALVVLPQPPFWLMIAIVRMDTAFSLRRVEACPRAHNVREGGQHHPKHHREWRRTPFLRASSSRNARLSEERESWLEMWRRWLGDSGGGGNGHGDRRRVTRDATHPPHKRPDALAPAFARHLFPVSVCCRLSPVARSAYPSRPPAFLKHQSRFCGRTLNRMRAKRDASGPHCDTIDQHRHARGRSHDS
jgi:hypothetical protein